MHLSRVQVGEDRTSEGTVLTPGDDFSSFIVDEGFKVGLLNCFDLRFQHTASILTEKLGCNVLLYPAAWLKTTGDLGKNQRLTFISWQSLIHSLSRSDCSRFLFIYFH